MIIGFTGTRRGLAPEQKAALEALVIELDPKQVRHGDCVGADSEFHDLVAQHSKARIHVHPPKNDKYRAFCATKNPDRSVSWPADEYLSRDRRIVNNSDLLIGCPSTKTEEQGPRSGTWYTIRYARNRHLSLIIITPDGVVTRAMQK